MSVAPSFDVAMDTVQENPDIELLVTDLHLGDGKLRTEVVLHVTKALGLPAKTVLITGDTSTVMRSIAHNGQIRLASKPIKADELLLSLKEQSETLLGQLRLQPALGGEAHAALLKI